jgi:hypothetical protein
MTYTIGLDTNIFLFVYLFFITYLVFSKETNELFIRTRIHYIFILCNLVLLLGIESGSFLGILTLNIIENAILLPFILMSISLLWLTFKEEKNNKK